MCMFCAELLKQSMTVKEVARALNEFEPKEEEHWEDIAKLISNNYDQQEVIEKFWELYKERLEK